MIFITYENDLFNFEIKGKDEDWDGIIGKFKKIWLFYDLGNKKWTCPKNRILEVIYWFMHYNFLFFHEESSLAKLVEMKKSIEVELKVNRKAHFQGLGLKDTTELFEYQKEGVDFFLKRNRAYNCDDAGLGKTLQAIATFTHRDMQKEIDGVFIVTRPTLTHQWEKEILKFSYLYTSDDIVIVDNSNKKKIFENIIDKKIMIVPNHLLGDVFGSYKSKSTGVKSRWRWKSYVNVLEAWQKKSIALVIDEAHELANPDAVKTKAMLTHKQYFEYRNLLSATPAINTFEKYHTAFRFMDESVFPMSYNAFKLYIAKNIGDNWDQYNIKEYDAEKIASFKNKFSTYMIKRLKKDLPEMKHKQVLKPVYLQMTQKHRELYETFTMEELSKLEQEHQNITPKLIFQNFPYLMQIIDNPLLLKGKIKGDHLTKMLKDWKFDYDIRFQALNDIIKNSIDNNEKLVIFDSHPNTLNLLALYYQEHHPLVMHGQMKDSPEDRNRKEDLFNDRNSKHKLFFINPQVGGIGLNLNAGTHRIVVYTTPFDPTNYAQLIDRCYRITNIEDALVEILILDDTFDTIRYSRIANKMELNNSLLTKNLTKEELKNLFLGII